MPAKVKICGLTSPADYVACHKAGAAFVGLVFHAASPRNLSYDQAKEIAAARQAGNGDDAPALVALSVGADDDRLAAIIAACRPDYLQLHGKESPARCQEIRTRFGLPLIKAMSVAGAADITAAKSYESIVDFLLFDAASGNPDMPGGTGTSFDWGLLAEADISCSWMLAGGLTPENVGQAIAQTKAAYVDVSSGVESSPGKKDYIAVNAFVSAANLG